MLLVILLLASFLRLYRIDVLMRFIWDEGRDMLAIRNIIVNHDLTLLGPFNEIAGHKDFFGVFHYYLMLPSLWLANFDPVGPAVFTALLGVASIGLVYHWLRGFADRCTAIIACALLATSPLVVRFQQWPWNPNTVGFFAAIYLIALQKYQLLTQKKQRMTWLALAGLSLGLLFQLHYFTIALGMVTLMIWFWQKRKDWRGALIFTACFMLPNLSFIVFDLTHAGFLHQIVWESLVGKSGQKFVTFSWSGIIFGPWQYLLDVCSKFMGSNVLGFGLLAIWLAYAWQKHKEQSMEAGLIFAWLVFLIMTSFFPKLLDDYHSATLWLSLALALARALAKISTKLAPTTKLAAVFTIPIVIWLIYANHFWRPPTWQENMPRLRTVGQVIARDAQQQNTDQINLASFVDPETRGVRFRYFVLNAGQKLLGFDDYPRSNILYAISPHTWAETRQNPAWELESFRAASASAIWSDGEWTVWRARK